VARRGRRTLRPRKDRFSYAGWPGPSTTAGNRKSLGSTTTLARSRGAHRLRRYHRCSGHHSERPLFFSEGKRMNTSTVIRGTLTFRRRGTAQEHDPTPATATTKASSPRIPRIAQLMALARHIDDLVRSGTVGSYAAAARLGHVSRARMSQIVALLHLAPHLQEPLLFLQRPCRGRPAPVFR